jgi:hypothetical protein
MKSLLLLAALLVQTGCGVYTFNSSSLPSHLKTIDIPLLSNQSMEPDIAEEITKELNRQILADNLLRIVSSEGNATIRGSVTSYTNEPYTFGATSTRQVNVDQYVVKITADIEFFDNVKDTPLFKEPISSQGVYDFAKETEAIGRNRAILELVRKILQNSLQSW